MAFIAKIMCNKQNNVIYKCTVAVTCAFEKIVNYSSN